MDQQIQLGKYRLFHHLATGGMGEVFLAVNEGPAGFSKTVVVKRILASVASDPAFVTMFLNEARLAALIEHPNVVQIFELGLEANTYFIAMEYVKGRSVRHIRHLLVERQQDLAPELAARICSQALQGLHHAHNLTDASSNPLQIVHRDVSPDNLLVGFNGVVKVVDFGIAKAETNVMTTRAGAVKGKYAYMAPEQLMGKAVDRRADVYAMGVVLYELLAGQRPFHADSEPGLIRAILHDTVSPPLASNPNIPPALSAIVMKAMARDPAERFEGAEAMSLALEGYIQSTGKTITHAHIGALLKTLFPQDAANKTPVPPSPRGPHAISFGLTPQPGSLPGNGAAPAAQESELPEIDIVMEADEAPRARLRPKWIAAAFGGVALLAGAAIIVPGRMAAKAQANAPTAVPAQAASSAEAAIVEEKIAPPVPIEAPVAVAIATPEPKRETRAPVDRPERVAKSHPSRRARPAQRTRKVDAASETPAAPSTGKVVLRVNPWAEVFWGGRSLGVTPMDAVELPVGTQVFTLRNPNLDLEKKVSVIVQADREVVLKADLLE